MKNKTRNYLSSVFIILIFNGCGPEGLASNKPLTSSSDSKTFIDKELVGNWMDGRYKFTIELNSNQLQYCNINKKKEKQCTNLTFSKINGEKYVNFQGGENKFQILKYYNTYNYISFFGKNKTDIQIIEDVKNSKIKGVLAKDGSLSYLSDTKKNLQKYATRVLTVKDYYFVYRDHSQRLSRWYNKQYALVIGINDYKNKKIPSLSNAKNDAKAVSKLLKKQGFDVTEIFASEATKSNIRNTIKSIKKKLSSNDSILIYFAGHGKGISLKNGDRIGYIIPYDFNGDLSTTELLEYDESAISLDDLKKYTYDFSAKHVMLMLDSCFSGLTFNTRALTQPRSGDMNYYDKLLKRKAINILTAGSDEIVADGQGKHSPFTYYLLKALDNGNIDLEDGDHFATFSELATYVKTKVAKATNGQQTPQFDKSNEDGEFIFQIHEK